MAESNDEIENLRNLLIRELGSNLNERLQNMARQGIILLDNGEIDEGPEDRALLRLMMIDYLRNNFRGNTQH